MNIFQEFAAQSGTIAAPSEQSAPFTVPRMETIKKTAEIFGLPVHFVRQKVLSGEIVAVRAGKRFLVNLDRFADYLNSSTVAETATRRSDGENASHVAPISLR